MHGTVDGLGQLGDLDRQLRAPAFDGDQLCTQPHEPAVAIEQRGAQLHGIVGVLGDRQPTRIGRRSSMRGPYRRRRRDVGHHGHRAAEGGTRPPKTVDVARPRREEQETAIPRLPPRTRHPPHGIRSH